MYFFTECEECSNRELRSFESVFTTLTEQWEKCDPAVRDNSSWFEVRLTRNCDCGHTTTYSSENYPMVAYLTELIFEIIVGRKVEIR